MGKVKIRLLLISDLYRKYMKIRLVIIDLAFL